MSISQFGNPSAVVPTAAGYYLFAGGGSGKNGRHQLQLQLAPMPIAAKTPTFAKQAWADVVNGTPGPAHGDGIVTPNGVFNGTPPYAMTLSNDTIELVYGGAETATGSAEGGIWAQAFTPQAGTGELLRVNPPTRLSADYGAAWADRHAYQPSIGVAQVPGEPIYVVAYADSTNKLQFCTRTLQPYDSPLDPRTYQEAALLRFDSDPAWTGDVSMTIVLNTQAGPNDPPFAMVWTMRYRDDKGSEWAQVWMSQVGVDDSGSVQAHGIEMLGQTGGHVAGLTLNRGLDAVPYLFWSRPADSVYCVGPVVTQVSGGPDPFATSCPLVDARNRPVTGVHQPPPVFYSFDPMGDGVDGSTVQTDVTRWVQFDQHTFCESGFGKAQRSCGAIPPHQPGQLGQLLGWIQGGPPVPNENIQARDLSADDSFGKVVFGDKETHTTEWSLKTSVGTAFSFHTEVGIPLIATVSLGLDISLGVTAGMSRETETEALTVVFATTKGVDDGQGHNAILGDGTALVLYPGFVQYVFTFLDDTGNPNPLAPTVVQLYVSGSHLEALTFQLDPEATTGIIPGELLSYVVDPQTRKELEGSAIAMSVHGNPSGWLTTSTSASGGANEEIAATVAGSASLGAYFDLKTTVGADAVFGEDKAEVSRDLKVDFDYTWKTSSTVQLACDLETDAVSRKQEEEGAFSSWTFDTILLQHDMQHTAELMAILTSYPTPDNTILTQRIQPNSIAWKITHILDDYVQPYPPGGDPAQQFQARHPAWQPAP